VALFRRREQDAPAPEGAQSAAQSAVQAAVQSAVHAAVAALHPGAEPRTLEVRAVPDRPFEGAVHAYRAEDHWLLVTEGLAGQDTAELTLRVAPDELAAAPPAVPWPFQVLVFLANSAVTSGRGFAEDARLDNDAPFNGDQAATARCLVFVADRALTTPGDDPESGSGTGVTFIQAVPVTADELETAGEKGTAAVTGPLAEDNPLLVARLYR
jgi:Suppressor of fused protein (SUFU)